MSHNIEVSTNPVDQTLWRARLIVHDALGDLYRLTEMIPGDAAASHALLRNTDVAMTEVLGLLDSLVPSPPLSQVSDAELILRVERAARKQETDHEARGELLVRMYDLRSLTNVHQRWEWR